MREFHLKRKLVLLVLFDLLLSRALTVSPTVTVSARRPVCAHGEGLEPRLAIGFRVCERATDAKGYAAAENVYRPEDFAASLYTKMGIDPVWFGIMFSIVVGTGGITPPFGLNLFALKGVAPPDVSMKDI